MADGTDAEAMMAAMAQMQQQGPNVGFQAPNGGPPNSMGAQHPMAGVPPNMNNMMNNMQSLHVGQQPEASNANERHRRRQSNLSFSMMETQAKLRTIDPMSEIEDFRAERVRVSIFYVIQIVHCAFCE